MAASLVMEMEQVLEARMASGLQTASSVWKICFLTSNFSVAASTTMSQAARSSRLGGGADAAQDGGLLFGGHLALVHAALEVLADGGQGLRRKGLADVA